jgi:hypothetical protein
MRLDSEYEAGLGKGMGKVSPSGGQATAYKRFSLVRNGQGMGLGAVEALAACHLAGTDAT